MYTEREAAVLAAVDEGALVRTLGELIAVPSVSGSAAEAEIQQVLARKLGELGAEVDVWSMDLEELCADPGFPGMEVEREEAWGVVGYYGGCGGAGARAGVVLQGHVDVVPPGDLAAWEGDPFVPRVRGDLVHGRGACDMKAGIAAQLAVVRALRDSGVRLRRPLGVHFVVGEEDGGIGAFGTLKRGHTGDVCVISEPTSGTVVTANAGALTFRLAVNGLAAHASSREQGVSALDAFMPIHHELRRLEEERNRDVDPLLAEYPIPYSLSIGTLRAGDWASSVPDLLVAEGRLGVRLGEDPAEARAAFEGRVAEVCAQDAWLREHPVEVTWPGGQFASGRLPAGHRLLSVVQKAHADTHQGVVPRERGATYGSDLRLYAGAGVPTLQYGPGDVAVAHSAREAVSVRETVGVARALALMVVRELGAA